MKRFFSILATIATCASASAQTVKPLAYNMTNGTVMVSTNVTWSNSFKFSTNTVAAQVRTNLGLGWSVLTNTNAATSLLGYKVVDVSGQTANAIIYSSTNLTLNQLWFSNVTRFDSIILGAVDNDDITLSVSGISTGNGGISLDPQQFIGNWAVSGALSWSSNSFAATTRSNLSLGLPALTNTSNVTAMRALSGSTNTNEPYSGTVALTNTNVLVFSNGILQSVQ